MDGIQADGKELRGHIVVLRALQLGDLLCAVPAFRALRKAYPAATISLVGLPWSQEFARRFGAYLDGWIEFPGFPGLPEREPEIRRIPHFLLEMQQLGSDLAVQMQGSGSVANPLVALFGAKAYAGFTEPGGYHPQPGRFLAYPDEGSEVHRLLRLAGHLGAAPDGDRLEFPLEESDLKEREALQQQYGFRTGEYAVLHAGARAEGRRWPAERFAAAGDGLARRGLQVVLTGSAAEIPWVRQVLSRMQERALDLSGQTSLGGAGALVAGARLVVCNDTGISHLAAALQTPSVVLFSASEVGRWAPLDRSLHRVLGGEGGAAVPPEAVLAEVDALLLEAQRHVA